MNRLLERLRLLRTTEPVRDPAVAAEVKKAKRHIRTNAQLLREMRAVQVKLERSSR